MVSEPTLLSDGSLALSYSVVYLKVRLNDLLWEHDCMLNLISTQTWLILL
jgi:hypothetical protein